MLFRLLYVMITWWFGLAFIVNVSGGVVWLGVDFGLVT